MTNAEIIQAIRNEIERLQSENNKIRCDSNKAYCQGYGDAFVDLLPFLSTLEKSEKSMNQEGLDVTDFCKPIDPSIAQCITDHFWEMLGEDEKQIVPNDLEEVAEHYASVTDPEAHGIDFIREVFIAGAEWDREQMISALKNDGDLPIEFIDKFHEIDRNAFKNGQENMKEQMMKEAVEAVVENWNVEPHPEITIPLNPEEFTSGDKVCVIICKKED